MNQDLELDVVVFGATGFTGRLVAGYLAAHAPADVRVGQAGRSEKRLANVRLQLPAAVAARPLLVADSADPASLAALARAARVVTWPRASDKSSDYDLRRWQTERGTLRL